MCYHVTNVVARNTDVEIMLFDLSTVLNIKNEKTSI